MPGSLLKRFLPRSLLGRSLLIIVTPLVILQLVSAYIFFENHWARVAIRLVRGVAGDVVFLVRQVEGAPAADISRILELAADELEMVATLRPREEGGHLPRLSTSADFLERGLAEELDARLTRPFRIDTDSLERHIIIDVDLGDRLLEIVTTRKRLFSTTTYVFVLWMIGTSMILFGVATIFMRNQVKPIRRLAEAADNFGKGRDAARFKPEGASEVRRAALAFLAMRERITRQIVQRTEMLAGVSHDLRTPLTRMKLQLAMLDSADGVAELKEDVAEMEHMLEGYLAFARGEGTEAPSDTDLARLLADVVGQFRRQGEIVDLHLEGEMALPLRPNALRRGLANLIGNAARYGTHVAVRAGRREDAIEILVDDDGPGIPPNRREEVFKPFYRLEGSRNPGTGGVGLGLTIARDVVRGHGGDIELTDSPLGGLRVRVRLPV